MAAIVMAKEETVQPAISEVVGPLMQIFEVMTQNLFEPATVDDLAAVTGLDREFVRQTMDTLRQLGYVRETEIGFQASEIKVAKFDWNSRVYDQYIRDCHQRSVRFRDQFGRWS